MTIKERTYLLGIPVAQKTIKPGRSIDAVLTAPVEGIKGFEDLNKYAYYRQEAKFTIKDPGTIAAQYTPPAIVFYDVPNTNPEPLPLYKTRIEILKENKINEIARYRRPGKYFHRKLIWKKD